MRPVPRRLRLAFGFSVAGAALVVALGASDARTSAAPHRFGSTATTSGVYVVSAGGRSERRLARTESVGFSWSPDGAFVAISSGEEDLIAVPVIGGPAQRLTRTKAYAELDPAWSPDGETIAFQANDKRQDAERWRIWTIRAEGTGRTRLSPLSDQQEESPSWSPDSRSLVFVREQHPVGQYNAYRMSAKGTVRRRLTKGIWDDVGPSSSPDGRLIAFTRSDTTLRFAPETIDNTWVMTADGAKERRLSPTNVLGSPAWSPDSKRLAFASSPWTVNDTKPITIWLVKVGGGGKRPLTQGTDPAWSPDGQRIAFVRRGGKQWDLYVINVDGTGLRRLTRSAIDEGLPAWSPDGSLIAFARSRY